MWTCLIGMRTTSLVGVLIDKGQTPICLYLVYKNLPFVIVGSIDQLTLVIDRDIAEWCSLFNNVIERLNREIRRRTRVVGTFPDGNSALMLVCARLRHVAGTQWGNKKYMNMKHLEAALDDVSIAG